MILLFVDVLGKVRSDDRRNRIVSKRESAIARSTHEPDSALHDAMKLNEEAGKQLREIRMIPERVGRGIEPGLGQTDFAPENVAVGQGHMRKKLRGRGRGADTLPDGPAECG